MTSKGPDGEEGPVKKGTGFLTNSPQIAKELGKVCDKSHSHVMLKGGSRCSDAQKYPKELCDAMSAFGHRF